ncbi:unnamed protein product [Ilex paraguariensis]|uniref:non-specific serine/threonine protein kinase n=1 Tax=Ilex paraguariensis TaxID=185542 RepID=A0ABC8RA67_9AQUA
MDGGEKSENILYRALVDRFRSLEASHAKLREQLNVLVQEQGVKNSRDDGTSDSGEVTLYTGWPCVPGVFSSGSPYRNVLEYMGHAVHVSRVGSGEIIFWNRSAEKLYGYKDYEVLGQRAEELLIDEEHYTSAKKIMEALSFGQSWSGQFPFKKRSGEIFMAIVTKSPLYEDGELVGIITVSSDAVVFNNKNSENMRTHQDRPNGQPKVQGINMKKMQWHPRPQIASSVSNLASKVLFRKRMDDECNACGIAGDREKTVHDAHNVRYEKPSQTPTAKPSFSLHIDKSTTDAASSEKDESSSEFAQPSRIAVKVLSKLPIRGIGNLGKVKNESTRQNVSNDSKVRKDSYTQRASEETSCHSGDYGGHEEDNSQKETPFAAESTYAHVNSETIATGNEEGSSVEALARDSNQCSEVPGRKYWLSKSGFPLDAKELVSDIQSSEFLEIDNAVQRHPDAQQFPSSGGSVGSIHESSSSKDENESNLVVASEIRWEDLRLLEEVGQGSFAVVYRGIWNGSDVAVKVYFGNQYSEDTLVDYRKEINIMRRLRHPNVLLFMGPVYSEEKLAIVTEFLPRGSLFKTLHKNNQSLDIRRRLRMALDVARGMNYLHHRNPPIVHRDLKSSNLLVDKNWTVKVGDFGLSKLKNATFLTAKSGRGTVRCLQFWGHCLGTND